MGWFTDDNCTTSNIEDPAESRAAFLSKDLQATRDEDEEVGKDVGKGGEAGKYVEFHSHGGIMDYIPEVKCGKSWPYNLFSSPHDLNS